MEASYPLHHEASGDVAASPAALFAHLDDPARLSSHMQKRSMAMMGATMQLETDALGGKAIGSVIRMRGRVLGIALGLEETVSRREPPFLKTWDTLGEPDLLVIGAYRMGFRIAASDGGSRLTVFIDYALPSARSMRWLRGLLAPVYARWCCARMLGDAQQAFRPAGNAQRLQRK